MTQSDDPISRERRFHTGRRTVLPVLFSLLFWPTVPLAHAGSIEIAATPIERFDAGGAARFGRLEFRGGLVLSSPSPDFGGLSGLSIDAMGEHFVAVTDRGFWLSGRIQSEEGRPSGISGARMEPMRAAGPVGKKPVPLTSLGLGDAESLARTAHGYIVGIERRQQVWSFPGADPLSSVGHRLLTDPRLDALGSNDSLEALLVPPDGKPAGLIIIAERSPDDETILPGFLFSPLEAPRPAGHFSVRRVDEFAATDAALADNGMVYLLERRFDYLRGVAMRIRRFPLSDIVPGAHIEGEVLIEANRVAAIDNMEAIALHREETGELVLTLLSDDNFSLFQRTILLRFAVVDE